jgi:hypothetical protein
MRRAEIVVDVIFLGHSRDAQVIPGMLNVAAG